MPVFKVFDGSTFVEIPGGGDVSAAANLTDNAIVRGDGGAKGVQDSGVLIDDSDNVSGIGNLTLSGTVDGRDVAADGSLLDAHKSRHMPGGADILQMSATDKILGRETAGAGNVEEIACTSAGRALIDDGNAAVQRITLGLGSVAVEDVPLPVSKGGTMQTTIQAAINTLSNVAAADDEEVLTKDTGTGNAIFKAASGGNGGGYSRSLMLMGG